MKKFWLVVFALALIFFAFLSTKIAFHDTAEYITIAKNMAGINNINIFSSHSLIYPSIISIFLRFWPTLTMVKLVNVSWIFLIGFLFFISKNEKAFLIFIFSPLSWIASIQTTPVLPVSFFFFLSFFLYKKNWKYSLILSGLFLGFSFAIYTPMILVSFFFILIYFFDRKLKDTLIYLVAFSIGTLPRFILDYYLFNMPLYSLIRYAGANLIVSIGLNSKTSNFHFLSNFQVLLIFIVISPLLFKLYRLDYKHYKKEILFILILFLIIFIRASLLKYFLIISPLLILLLAKVIKRKEIKWHIFISLLLIALLTWSYFTPNVENIIKEDLNSIIIENSPEIIIAGPFEAPAFAQLLWENQPEVIWFQDFQTSQENKTTIRDYNFNFNSKIPLKDRLVISASFKRYNNRTYSNPLFVTKISNKDVIPEEYSLMKCYNLLCTYS